MVPERQWVEVDCHAQIEMWRNGVKMRLGKGRHRVPPYVRDCYQEYLGHVNEEEQRKLFEQRRLDITEEVYKNQRGIQAEVYHGFSWNAGR
jgi:hypothetical protein